MPLVPSQVLAAMCHVWRRAGAGVRWACWVLWVPWVCWVLWVQAGSRTVAGRERTAVSHEGGVSVLARSEVSDDKQLRERDLRQIKSEGKVHYLRR